MPDSKPSMMEEKKEAQAPGGEEPQELEFRPWVLWSGVGLAGLASLGLLIFTYFHSFEKGYQQGYQEGDTQGFNRAISANLVQESLSKAAEQNVLALTRLYTASDECLQQAAADTDKVFGWIKDTAVRLEAEWYLADALLQRQLADGGIRVLDAMLEKAPHTQELAYRVFRAATMLSVQEHAAAAERYYKVTAGLAAETKLPELRMDALGRLVACDLGTPQSTAEALNIWKKRYSELKSMGEETRPLRSLLLVHMAEQYRTGESRAAAEKLYRAALEGVDLAQVTEPEYASCYGTALLALGEAAAAEPLLRHAASNVGTLPVEVSSRILALRQLASIEQGRGQNAVALALLQRAQGVAEGRVHPTNTFWPCLFDQRGWLQYLALNYQAALMDFNAALAATQEPLLMIQPLEGAARCHLELTQIDEARKLLEQCLALRQQHLAADKSSIGRVHLLLGQIYDQQGNDKEAEAAYGAAVAHMNTDAPADEDNRRLALLGQAYALTELRRWQEAYGAWEKLLPLLDTQHDRREEARRQMSRIKPYLPGETESEPETEQPDTAETPQ